MFLWLTPYGTYLCMLRRTGVASLRDWSLLFFGTAQIPGGASAPKPTIKPTPLKTSSSSRKKTKLKLPPKPITLVPNPATSSVPLTLILGPGNMSHAYKVPAPYNSYPKVQQLFPQYVHSTARKLPDTGKGVNKLKSERQSNQRTKSKKPASGSQVKEKVKESQKKNTQEAIGVRRGGKWNTI